MKIISLQSKLPSQDRGASVAIGNFDGVHIGHQVVIDITRKQALQLNLPLGILTFEPHPREFFAPNSPPFRLMNAEAKTNRLEKLGVDHLYQLPFDASIANLTPEQFANNILFKGFGIKHIVVGKDFCFGNGRSGTAIDLEKFGRTMGFGVTVVDLLQGVDGNISSTNIRNAMSEGRPGDAAKMLGHWHRIDGEVFHGDHRGRELGFPTANMSINRLHPPKFGIYAVLVDVLGGPHKGSYRGAASVGVRPMFGENKPNLEAHLFDFEGDLYGEHLSVAFVEYLRPELKFDGVDDLVVQMGADCRQARSLLDAL